MSSHDDPQLTAPEGQEQPVVAPEPGPAPLPSHVGRYRVERILGQGGFGLVYLAHDDELRRFVAVKVPHPHLVPTPAEDSPYLAEDRTAAGLDHPHIVPVFDVGTAPGFPFFLVSKFIDGQTLAWAIHHDRPTPMQTEYTESSRINHAGLGNRDPKARKPQRVAPRLSCVRGGRIEVSASCPILLHLAYQPSSAVPSS